MQVQPVDPTQAAHAMAVMLPVIFLLVLIFQLLVVVPLWVAFKKAGLAGPLALIALVPTFGPIVALFILAFSRWKTVPAPEYTYGTVPPGYAPPGYAPAVQPPYPPATGYTAPGAYTPTQPPYPPPPPTQNS